MPLQIIRNDMTIYLVVYGALAYNVSRKMFADIQSFIDDRYVQGHPYARSRYMQELDACPAAPLFGAAPALSAAAEKEARPLESRPSSWIGWTRAFPKCSFGRSTKGA